MKRPPTTIRTVFLHAGSASSGMDMLAGVDMLLVMWVDMFSSSNAATLAVARVLGLMENLK